MELEVKTQHYVQWSFPHGSNGFAMEIEEPTVDALKIPPGAYAFTFFKIHYTEAEIDGKTIMMQSSKLTGDDIKHYLYGAIEFTVDQVEHDMGDPRSANQWRKKGVERVARTLFGSLIPVDDNIKVLGRLPDQELTSEEFEEYIEEKARKSKEAAIARGEITEEEAAKEDAPEIDDEVTANS